MISIICKKSNGGKIDFNKSYKDFKDEESDQNNLQFFKMKQRPEVIYNVVKSQMFSSVTIFRVIILIQWSKSLSNMKKIKFILVK